MKRQSVSALAWAALVCIVLGLLMMSSGAAFLLYLIAAVQALLVSVLGRQRSRLAGVALLLMALLLLVQGYEAFQQESDTYRQRVKSKPPASSPHLP